MPSLPIPHYFHYIEFYGSRFADESDSPIEKQLFEVIFTSSHYLNQSEKNFLIGGMLMLHDIFSCQVNVSIFLNMGKKEKILHALRTANAFLLSNPSNERLFVEVPKIFPALVKVCPHSLLLHPMDI